MTHGTSLCMLLDGAVQALFRRLYITIRHEQRYHIVFPGRWPADPQNAPNMWHVQQRTIKPRLWSRPLSHINSQNVYAHVDNLGQVYFLLFIQ